MQIVDLPPANEGLIEQVGLIMVAAFRESAPTWCPDLAAGLVEVRVVCTRQNQPDSFSR